ncbi:MAG: hypothetical protein IKZ49_02665 [Alphaproteobacteria bacterium]|nr:hypothetical protein [Alphaproteobacteria bacterium]
MPKIFYALLMLVVVMPENVSAAVNRARAGASQKVVNAGTKVAAATKSNLLDKDCEESFFGCLDAFCVVENVSGGRCVCSNKHADLSAQLDEILKMDEDAYAISTYGVEHINLGKAADSVISASEKAFDKAKKDAEDEDLTEKKSAEPVKKKTLSFDEWNKSFGGDDDDEDEEETASLDEDDISNKKGDELYIAAAKMCWTQVPDKCKPKEEMAKMLYTQKIKSDCAAFENSVKQKRTESTNKLETAKKNVRDAAFESLQASNKFDMGQCAIEYVSCLRKDDICGKDLTKCVTLAANENVTKGESEQVEIKGEFSSISIAASTMDSLNAKRAMCASVTDQCSSVDKDELWTLVLKNIAPELKNAELIAESDLRGNCLTNISECYLKACKDNMDPKDPDGSYDMCLARPDNYKSFCKVQLEPCLAATGGSYDDPDSSTLWRGVLAKLAAMRVDACTDEFKSCLQSEDRCGEDYSQCIGLDNDDVAKLCPEDKLPACYKEYNGKVESVNETLERIAQGVMLNVDNGLLAACENAINEAMVKVCGDAENCNKLAVDSGIGSRTLKLEYCETTDEGYVNCKQDVGLITDIELGKTTRDSNLKTTKHDIHFFSGVYRGVIDWSAISVNDDVSGITDYDEYAEKAADSLKNMNEDEKTRIKSEIGSLASAIKNAISAVESDPKIQFCTTGRQVEGLANDEGFTQKIGKGNNPSFPNITQTMRNMIVNSALQQARENYNKKLSELEKQEAEESQGLASRIAQISGENEKVVKQDMARKACIALAEKDKLGESVGSSVKKAIERVSGSDGKLTGHSAESSYNYKRSITTTFNLEDMICHKCIRTQHCEKTKTSYCKQWGEEVETCEDIHY